jgi:hypothetical protein
MHRGVREPPADGASGRGRTRDGGDERVAVEPGRGSGQEWGMGQPGLMECVGPLALLEGAEWLDRMHDKAAVSLLSRRPCLQSWADAFPSWEPWILALVEDCEVRAVAPLARRRGRWGVEVVSVGDSALDESPVAACDDAAVAALAAGLVDALQALGRPWVLRLRQLPAASALAAALVAQLSTTVVFAGPPDQCSDSLMTVLPSGG